MSETYPSPVNRDRRRPSLLALPIAVGAALLVLAACHSHASSSNVAAPHLTRLSGHLPRRGSAGVTGELPRPPRGSQQQARDVADGEVPDGVTVFDDQYPAVAKLDPGLLSALRTAARSAATDGVELDVDSGWRSRSYQEQLFHDAVAEHGSAARAARWVAPPGTSAHEAGKAVDLGPSRATAWLSEHGAAYGLCQIYRNEPWHYELRPAAVDHGCPAMYADPTDDPRMQQ